MNQFVVMILPALQVRRVAQNTRNRISRTVSFALVPNTRGPDFTSIPHKRHVARSSSLPTTKETMPGGGLEVFVGEFEADEVTSKSAMIESLLFFAHLINSKNLAFIID